MCSKLAFSAVATLNETVSKLGNSRSTSIGQFRNCGCGACMDLEL